MPLTDSQLAGLIQIVLEQQKEIVLLKAGTIALLNIARESGVSDVETRFQTHTSRLVADTIPESSLATLRALEQVLLQLKHSGQPEN